MPHNKIDREITIIPAYNYHNIEIKLPRSYVDAEGFNITKKGINYLAPLIKGEDFPKFQNGMPVYAKLRRQLVAKKLNQKW